MNLPAGFPYALNQDVEIPLEHIIPNPEQPRIFVDQADIEVLAASMRAKGQEVAARVRPLTEQERVTYPNGWVMLIGGHGRREAALLNQWKTLKCNVQPISPEDTLATAARDNNIRDMHWWEWYLVIEGVAKGSSKSQEAIGIELGQSPTRVNYALKVTKAFNSAARALVQENLQKSLKKRPHDVKAKNKGFSITEQTLLTLADLEDENQVLEAVQTVLDDYLTPDQTKKLVEHIQTGEQPETYKAQAAPKAAKSADSQPHAAHVAMPSDKPEAPTAASPVQPKHTTQPKAATQTPPSQDDSKMSSDSTSSSLGTGTTKARTSAGSLGAGENAIWDGLAGISVITQIRAKIKKGERPTWGESLILAIDLLWRALHWLSKAGWKVGKLLTKTLWKLIKESLHSVFKFMWPKIKFAFGLIVLVGFIWLAWDIHEHGYLHPLKLAATKLMPAKVEPTSVPTMLPTAMPTAVAIALVPTAVPTLEPTPVPTKVMTKRKKAVVAQAIPTVQATPTVQKKDVVGDAAGSVANKVAPDLAADAAKKIFGL